MKPTLEFYTLFQFIYDHFNKTLYNDELPSCMIVITRKNRTFGYYSSKRWVNKENKETDELAINPMFFSEYPLIEMLQTVAHEMCHLWQNHFGKETRRTYHNKEWGNKMISIGLMPSNTGKPGGKKTGQQMMEYPIDGGLFIKTCKSLVKNPKFEKLWYDRTTNIQLQELNHSEEEDEIIDTMSIEDQDSLRLLYSSFSIENPLIKTSSKESNSKSKYQCFNCNINLWGNPIYILYVACVRQNLKRLVVI